MLITIDLPKHFQVRDVAETFAAMLLGSRAFNNVSREYGPYEENGKWQLDGSNDYILREDNGKLLLSCRYDSQAEILNAMAVLFNARYVKR